nr:integrase core domain-containing protein [Rhodococcus sp. 06-418-1B]
MHLWQLDLVGGLFLADGRECKILTGIDDHSQFVITATILQHPSGNAVVEAFLAAVARWGVPFEVLTDNGKQFTGKHTRPLPVEVLFERTCREFGISSKLTKRHSPTTTGKIERFHRTLRRELLDEAGPFTDIESAQAALDQWVHAYNTVRPHQSLDMATPASLFRARDHPAPPDSTATPQPSTQQPFQVAHPPASTRQRSSQAIELDVRVPPSGVIAIAGIQQMRIGKNHAGRVVTLWLDLTSIHVIADDVVIKTILSRLTTTDLERPAMRGARPGRPAPSSDAVDPSNAVSRPIPIEVDRTASRDGIVVIAHHQLRLGVAAAGTKRDSLLDTKRQFVRRIRRKQPVAHRPAQQNRHLR